MKKALTAILALSVLFLLSSCLLVDDLDGGSGYYVDSGSGYYLDGGTYIDVYPKGMQWITHDLTSVYVTLDANTSTGYQWSVDISGDSVYLDSQSYSTGYSEAIGAGGTWNAKFGTTGFDGTSYVTLSYERPWDSYDVAYTVTFCVTTYFGTISDVTVL